MSDQPQDNNLSDDGPSDLSENAVQLLRSWADDGSLVIELDPVWEDPSNWGLFLADITRHIAMVHAEEHGGDAGDALQTIVDALQDELENPSEADGPPPAVN